MLNLDSTEEIIAILAAVAIIMGFAITTYKEINTTVAEEKSKAAAIKEAEEKVKELIEYLDAKSELINTVAEANKKIDDMKK
jgi:nitrogen regulatory protein PII-like uncharacterized protein